MLDNKVWQIVQNGVSCNYTVLEGRPHGKFLVVKFEGMDDRDEVAALTNAAVVVNREDLSVLSEGDYYWVDLIGLAVTTVNGVALGKVESLMETGANDVLVVNGDRERLIPWIMGDAVQSVDLAAGEMVVDWDPDF